MRFTHFKWTYRADALPQVELTAYLPTDPATRTTYATTQSCAPYPTTSDTRILAVLSVHGMLSAACFLNSPDLVLVERHDGNTATACDLQVLGAPGAYYATDSTASVWYLSASLAHLWHSASPHL